MTEARCPSSGFFDAHCDTVIKVLDEGADFLRSGGAHVTFPAMKAAGIRAQVFACYVLSERYPEREAQRAEAMIARLRGWRKGPRARCAWLERPRS